MRIFHTILATSESFTRSDGFKIACKASHGSPRSGPRREWRTGQKKDAPQGLQSLPDASSMSVLVVGAWRSVNGDTNLKFFHCAAAASAGAGAVSAALGALGAGSPPS